MNKNTFSRYKEAQAITKSLDDEGYGPIMIRNGFLRDSCGSWTNLLTIKYFVIKEIEDGVFKGMWSLYVYSDEGYKSGSFLRMDNKNDAQKALDHILENGVIRFENKKPILTD